MENRPCQNPNNENCPVFQVKGYCFEDVHHLYYPKSSYSNGFAQKFRELDENKVEICRDEHNEIHATERSPYRPSMNFIKEAIRKSNERRKNEQA